MNWYWANWFIDFLSGSHKHANRVRKVRLLVVYSMMGFHTLVIPSLLYMISSLTCLKTVVSTVISKCPSFCHITIDIGRRRRNQVLANGVAQLVLNVSYHVFFIIVLFILNLKLILKGILRYLLIINWNWIFFFFQPIIKEYLNISLKMSSKYFYF